MPCMSRLLFAHWIINAFVVAIFLGHENGEKKANEETTRARNAGWNKPLNFFTVSETGKKIFSLKALKHFIKS